MGALGDLHHVGITVRDLDASLAWYSDVLGVEPEVVAEGSGEELGRAVGVPDARLRFAMLRLGGAVVELLCYDNDREETFTRSNADVGSAHVCIDVPDLQAGLRRPAGQGGPSSSPRRCTSPTARWPAARSRTSATPTASPWRSSRPPAGAHA